MSATREELRIKSAQIFSEMQLSGIEHQLTMTAAYDLRSHPQNYGIHGMEFYWVAKRRNAAVTWLWMTPFYLPHVREELARRPHEFMLFEGLGDVGYHSPTPLYTGQYHSKDCIHTGGDCYYDGTSLGSQDLFAEVVGDPEKLWLELDERLVKLEAQIAEMLSAERNLS